RPRAKRQDGTQRIAAEACSDEPGEKRRKQQPRLAKSHAFRRPDGRRVREMHAETMHRPAVRNGKEPDRGDQHSQIDSQAPDQADESLGEAPYRFWHAVARQAGSEARGPGAAKSTDRAAQHPRFEGWPTQD